MHVGGGGGGGGTGGGPPATPTPRPTKTPVATATPTQTPTPVSTVTASSNACSTTATTAPAIGTAATVTARPLTTGDAFTYAGSSLDATVYCASTPNPSSTVAYGVTQKVVDVGPTPFDGATPYDFHTTEVDAGSQTIDVTTDAYFADVPINSSQTGLYTYGYTTSNTNGQTITQALVGVPASNGLLDVTPEVAGTIATTNSGANTLQENESDGFSASRTTAANGSYSETDTYPQPSNFSSPAPLVLTISANADGSGSYMIPKPNGNGGYNGTETFTYSAPSNGFITISSNDGNPSDAGSVAVGTWYAPPLYSENDVDDGDVAIPAMCNVSPAFGATGNEVEQRFERIDPVIGTDERFDQATYVVNGYSVCTTLTDATYIYYDYSGQANTASGLVFSGGNIPAERDVLTSTLGLTSSSESAAARRADTDSSAAARVVAARTNFLAVVERHRLARLDRAVRHLRSVRLGKALR